MQAAIQRIIDIERNENPEEDPEADPLGLIALGRDALGTDPSPMLEVVRAAVEWSEYSDCKYDENGDLEQVATPWPQTARLNRAVEKLGPEWRQ